MCRGQRTWEKGRGRGETGPPKKGREKEGEDRAREGETEEERTSIPLLPTLHVSSSIFHFTSNSKGAELYMSEGREGWKRKCVFNWVNFVTNTTQAHLPPSPRSRRPLLVGQAPVQIKQRKRRGTEKRAIWGIVARRLAEHTKKVMVCQKVKVSLIPLFAPFGIVRGGESLLVMPSQCSPCDPFDWPLRGKDWGQKRELVFLPQSFNRGQILA